MKQGATTLSDVSSRGQTYLHDGAAWRKQEPGAKLFISHGICALNALALRMAQSDADIRLGLVLCRILLNGALQSAS